LRFAFAHSEHDFCLPCELVVRERSGGMMDASVAGEEGGEACRAAADLGLHHR